MRQGMEIDSPLGKLVIAMEEDAICAVMVKEHVAFTYEASQRDLLKQAAEQLNAYFAGKLRQFDLPLAMKGTPFQVAVWQWLRIIPYGETRSYLDVAKGIGRPQAVRAVGNAVGRNPFLIVVPCHRIIGTDGGLHGFSAGIERKIWLQKREGILR